MDIDPESRVAILMSVLCALGGVIGYLKASSRPSLIAGLSLSSLFAASTYLINRSENPQNAFLMATITSIALAGAMVSRYFKTRAIFPAGFMAVCGVASIAYHANKYSQYSF